MGYYKNLLIAAQEGDQKAAKTIAEDYESKGDLKQAIKWYAEAGNSSKADKLLERLQNESNSRGKSTVISGN